MPGSPATSSLSPAVSIRLETFRTWARRVTLTSVFANALFGIWAVAGPLDDLGSAALVTSLLITAAGVTSVACAASITERRIGVVAPVLGIAAAVAGYALLITATWTDLELAPLWRLGGSLVVAAVGVGYVSLISGFRPPGRYRRLLGAAYILAALAGVFLVAVLWGYEPGEVWRLFGIAAVLLGALTIAVPVAARLRPSGAPEIRHCPYCGGPSSGRAGSARCTACRRRYRVSEA